MLPGSAGPALHWKLPPKGRRTLLGFFVLVWFLTVWFPRPKATRPSPKGALDSDISHSPGTMIVSVGIQMRLAVSFPVSSVALPCPAS